LDRHEFFSIDCPSRVVVELDYSGFSSGPPADEPVQGKGATAIQIPQPV
jgi:hypothetical protein